MTASPLTPIDEESPWFDIFAGFRLSLDTLNKSIQRRNHLLERAAACLPIPATHERLLSLGAGVLTGTVDFGTPLPGRRWVVRLFAAVENPVGTAAPVAAVVTWYVGPEVSTGAGVFSPTSARWQFRQIPDFQRFTADTIHVRPGQSLVAGLTGMPAGGSETALIASIDDYPAEVRMNG